MTTSAQNKYLKTQIFFLISTPFKAMEHYDQNVKLFLHYRRKLLKIADSHSDFIKRLEKEVDLEVEVSHETNQESIAGGTRQGTKYEFLYRYTHSDSLWITSPQPQPQNEEPNLEEASSPFFSRQHSKRPEFSSHEDKVVLVPWCPEYFKYVGDVFTNLNRTLALLMTDVKEINTNLKYYSSLKTPSYDLKYKHGFMASQFISRLNDLLLNVTTLDRTIHKFATSFNDQESFESSGLIQKSLQLYFEKTNFCYISQSYDWTLASQPSISIIKITGASLQQQQLMKMKYIMTKVSIDLNTQRKFFDSCCNSTMQNIF